MNNYSLFKILLPKQGNTEEECEDSLSFLQIKYDKKKIGLNIAIADGATESSFAKEWANILTRSFNKSKLPLNKTFLKKLPVLRKKFSGLMQGKVLPWYAQEKADKGAFSTFLGIRINLIEHKYDAVAIGDCCYFQIREDVIINQSPIIHSEEFGNNPYLVSSNPVKNIDINNYLIDSKGDLQKGDILMLMSDALAHWFLKNNESNDRPWEILIGIKNEIVLSNESFILWLNEQRKLKCIKNDDVVLAILEF